MIAADEDVEQLRRRARVALAQASVIAEASAATLQEQTSHGKTQGGTPSTAGASTFEDAVRVLRRVQHDTQLLEAVEHMEKLIRETRYSRIPDIDPQTREGKLRIGLDPRPVSVVAYVYGFSERTIWRWRAEASKLPGAVLSERPVD